MADHNDFDSRVTAHLAAHPNLRRSEAMAAVMRGADVAEQEAMKDPIHARAVAWAARSQREGRPLSMSAAMNDCLLGRDIRPSKDAATIAAEAAAAKRAEIEAEATRLAEVQFDARVSKWMEAHPELRRSEAISAVLFGRDIEPAGAA